MRRPRSTQNRRRKAQQVSSNCAEQMEQRILPAGIVKVAVKGNDLVVTGDRVSNSFIVEEHQGEVRVRKLFQTTEVVGGDTGIPAGQLGRLTINSKGGDDYVEVGLGLSVGGDLIVKQGGGDDLLDFKSADGGTFVGGKTIIKTGGGDDQLYFDGVEFTGDVTAVMGGGNDEVYVAEFNPIVEFQAKATIKLGGGNDSLFIDNSTVADWTMVSIDGGGGQDGINWAPSSLIGLGANVRKFEIDL
ncbi:MAG: hypothetical protein AB8G99_08890 [Planctomycetaceae bacterium]